MAGSEHSSIFATKFNIGQVGSPTAGSLFVQNDTDINGAIAVGNLAVLGVDTKFGYTFGQSFDLSQTRTDFTAAATFNGLSSYFEVAPTVNLTGGNAKALFASDIEIVIPSGNTFDVNALEAQYFGVRHLGSGTVSLLYGNDIEVGAEDTGNVTFQTGLQIGSTHYGSGSITNNFGLVLNTGHNGAGTIGNNYGAYISTPPGAGSITENYGIYLEDQAVGGSSFAFYSAGGTVYFAGDVGIGISTPNNKLDVLGDSNFDGDVDVQNFLTVWNVATFTDDVDISGSLLLSMGTSATAGADMVLTIDGNTFYVDGSTTIDSIVGSGWNQGTHVTLIFNSSPLVKHGVSGGFGGQKLLLAGSLDFQAALYSVLGLVFTGTEWQETFRKVV